MYPLRKIFMLRIFTWCLLLPKLVIVPSKKDLGLAFKGSQKMVVEALEVIHLFLML
jgi:hypothetical protein